MTAAAQGTVVRVARFEQSNQLPVLANRINNAHAAVKAHSRATIAEMMAAGDDLIAAKALCGHGNWLAWLKANCPDISERTAHRYTVVIESFTNRTKLCLSLLGTDPHQRSEFFKRALVILRSMQAEHDA